MTDWTKIEREIEALDVEYAGYVLQSEATAAAQSMRLLLACVQACDEHGDQHPEYDKARSALWNHCNES